MLGGSISEMSGWATLPAPVRRLRRWYWLVPAWITAGALRAALKPWLPEWVAGGAVSFGIAAGAVATILLVRLAERCPLARAAAADYRLCPTCLYPLAGEAGVCPECREAFTVEGRGSAGQGRRGDAGRAGEDPSQ